MQASGQVAEAGDIRSRLETARAWLQTVYGGTKSVPEFEVNVQTLAALDSIRKRHEERKLLLELRSSDARSHAAQYKAESRRLEAVLQSVGLAPDNNALSSEARRDLQGLASLAQALGVKNLRQSSIIAAVGKHFEDLLSAERRHRGARERLRALESRLAEAKEMLDSVDKANEALDKQSEAREAKARLANERRRKARDETKKDMAHIEAFRARVRKSGITPQTTHEAILTVGDKIQSLEQEKAELFKFIKNYQDLPPSLSEAKAKIQDARARHEQLELEFKRRCASMCGDT